MQLIECPACNWICRIRAACESERVNDIAKPRRPIFARKEEKHEERVIFNIRPSGSEIFHVGREEYLIVLFAPPPYCAPVLLLFLPVTSPFLPTHPSPRSSSSPMQPFRGRATNERAPLIRLFASKWSVSLFVRSAWRVMLRVKAKMNVLTCIQEEEYSHVFYFFLFFFRK